MPKRSRRSSTTAAQSSNSKRTRLVKIWLTDQEMQDLRVAAALQDEPVSTFARQAAMAEAQTVIKERYSGGS